MARKNIDLKFLPEKEVEVISDDDGEDYDDHNDDHDDDADDPEEILRKYSKPVSVYKIFAERSRKRPNFLRRCLKYIIKAKKNKESISGETIIFNYMDSKKNILRYEGVNNCSCPFCLMLCGDQWGLRDHLESSHDVFEFEFWRAEEDHGPEIDVTLKYDDNSSGEGQEIDHNKIPYYFCSRRRRKRMQRKGRNRMKRLNVRFLDWDLNELPSDNDNECTHVNDVNVSSPPKAHSPEETCEVPPTTPPLPAIAQSTPPLPAIAQFSPPLPAIAQSSPPLPAIAQSSPPLPAIAQSTPPLAAIAESSPPLPEIAQSSEPQPAIAQSSEPQPAIAQSSKSLRALAKSSKPKVPRASKRKKSLAERLKAERYLDLKSRQFYHSQTKQPMTYEEVMSNEDSENEEDDYAADIKERLRLLQIVDASKEEKRFMYLWNIFIRKKRVIADRYVPLACEEFTKLHKQELMKSTSFFWWWRLFRMTLWKHGLISAKTIDKCSIILQNSDEARPSISQGIIFQNSDEAGPSTSQGIILQNSDEAGPSTFHGIILRNSDETGPFTSPDVILRNSDETGLSTSPDVILRNSDETGPSTSHGVILRNSYETEPSTFHSIILRNSVETGPSTSSGVILRNSVETGPSTSPDVILRNSDEAGPSTSHVIILRNSDEAGPSTSHGTANANTEQWMEVDGQ